MRALPVRKEKMSPCTDQIKHVASGAQRELRSDCDCDLQVALA